MGVVILESAENSALLLVTAAQLEDLARLRFEPRGTDELGGLAAAHAQSHPWVAAGLQPLLQQAQVSQQRLADASEGETQTIGILEAEVEKSLAAITAEQQAALTSFTSVDDDGDGLTNTQEGWWCTGTLNPDSDGDGVGDGAEVQAARDWLGNVAPSYSASGKPFLSWPSLIPGCYDDDQDSVPDLAETWDLGLNPNRESTDRDKFDDGQELFGLTYCPGSAGFCGYGTLPRSADWGIIFAEMPTWVQRPGNHPLVAATPAPEVEVLDSSLHMETVTTVTTDKVISQGTERTYSTARTQGTSSSLADTQTWNSWEETSVTVPTEGLDFIRFETEEVSDSGPSPKGLGLALGSFAVSTAVAGIGCAGTILSVAGVITTPLAPGAAALCVLGLASAGIDYGQVTTEIDELEKDIKDSQSKKNQCTIPSTPPTSGPMCAIASGIKRPSGATAVQIATSETETQNPPTARGGTQYRVDQNSNVVAEPLFQASFAIAHPVPTITTSRGESRGGARTTTHTNYEEHTITNGEAFSSEESWGTATAVNSAHAADLWFTYQVRNDGTEYARQICNLAFNLYIGDDPNPATTYFVANDVGGDGCFANFMPGEDHEYTSARIPISLEQMKAIDLGGPVRMVVEDYSYGIDELFYEDAAGAGVLVALEDGIGDGDELIDSYLIPTWGNETAYDVLARYFPHETDADGNLTAIWTPEYRSDTPAWCVEPQVVGGGAQRTLWCKHALSTADWWNIYTSGLGDGTEGFQDTPASPGATALFRFNQDSDLDGYSDRSEDRLGTDKIDPADYPRPELLAGVHSRRTGNQVVATLSLLNSGLYDAYGVEAVMIAPDNTTTITNNTVGGSGRVRAQRDVIVGSRILLPEPLPAAWANTGHARPSVAGYYTGSQDRIYTFTVNCTNPCSVGSGTWNLNWNDDTGNSGTLNYSNGYASPTFLNVGTLGLQLALLSGTVNNGESFTVQARTPRDTFQYEILSEPYTPPLVLVSYNDPQGNHRFLVPADAMTLSDPTRDLLPYAGQMLLEPGVEIVTDAAHATGANTTTMLVNNPSGTTIQNAHLFLNFIDVDGNVVLEAPAQATIPPGPSVIPITWSTASFNPAYNPDADYIVMVFWTDYQGNILDTAARPLSSFQEDPDAVLAFDIADLTWDFGTAAQGTLLQRRIVLGSTGYQSLLTHIGSAPGIIITAPQESTLGPADMGIYTLQINTADLPVGPFSAAIPLRTSDPANAEKTLTIQGNITPFLADDSQMVTVRPVDEIVTVTDGTQGQWVTYPVDNVPELDMGSLHPVRLLSEDGNTLYGVGRYAVGEGEPTYMNLGTGAQGDLLVATGQTVYADNLRSSLTVSAASGQDLVQTGSAAFEAGMEVLLYQVQGTNAGRYEFAVIESVNGNTIQLTDSLANSFTVGGNSKATVTRVPHYQNITIRDGGVLTGSAWDGSTGGILAFRATGTVQIETGGRIDVSSLGYRGGTNGSSGGQTGQQGESELGIGSRTGSGTCNPPSNRNGAGGGGGNGDSGDEGSGGGGAGGGHAAAGGWGDCGSYHAGGLGGWALGSPDMSQIFFGGGGGGGGNDNNDTTAGDGGNGGGIVLAFARHWNVAGNILANASAGGNGNSCSGGGGGGAGGSIRLAGYELALNAEHVVAAGGARGIAATCSNPSHGGNGSVGRVRIEFCEAISGTTNPSASQQRLGCYILEQVDTAPYNQGRLSLPETFTGSRDYIVEYGRRFVHPTSGEQTSTVRVPAGFIAEATLSALVSEVGSGDVTFRLDIGNDGTWDWEATQNITNADELDSANLNQAFNAYWSSQGAPTTGTLDVPVHVSLSKAGQVLLTDFEVTYTSAGQQGAAAFDGILAAAEAMGTVVEVSAANATSLQRPLDWLATFTGAGTVGQKLTYSHTLGPDPATLHPVRVYSESYTPPPWGVGNYATDFLAGTAPGDMFGDGRDGVMPSSGNLNVTNGVGFGTVNGTVNSTSIAVVNRNAIERVQQGDVVLIHQTLGTGAGNWELNKAVSDFTGTGTFVLQKALKYTYSTSGSNVAQIMRVPQYSTCNVTGTVTPLVVWSGAYGGIVAFLCKDSLTVSGSIDASGDGFRGGAGTNSILGSGSSNAFQGESYTGLGTVSVNRNATAGGGGTGGDAGGGGGGGGYGLAGEQGANGQGTGGQGGTTVGSANLSAIYFGGGGGGGRGESNANCVPSNTYRGGNGAVGGGIVFAGARSISILGNITASGGNGGGATGGCEEGAGGGGGGAGGAILLQGQSISLGSNKVIAAGGARGPGSGSFQSYGGAGGAGRVRLEYCESLAGTTNPGASPLKMQCHIVEQLVGSPSQGELTLPESFSDGRTYAIQYGRRFAHPAAGDLPSFLRVPAGAFSNATLHALISGVGTGNVTFRLDIGDDGTWDWEATQNVTNAVDLGSIDLSGAFNAFWSANGAPSTGTLDVPVRVYLSKAGQVLLTDLQMTGGNSRLRFVRLPAEGYADVLLNMAIGQGSSGNVTIAADVGDNGSVDWTWTGAYPATPTTSDLAAAFNNYLGGRSGEVDVPVRFFLPADVAFNLTGATLVPSGQADATLTAGDISFGAANPVEGGVVPVTATLHNNGNRDSDGVTAAFFATLPGRTQEWYIGSAYVPNIPAGGTANATLDWDTLGFTGSTTVRVEIDPYLRLIETDDGNNRATTSLTILTRPDLFVNQWSFSNLEPVLGEGIDVTTTVSNGGQAAAAAATYSLYDGSPDGGGVLVQTVSGTSINGAGQQQLVFEWTPTSLGEHQLFLVLDEAEVVSESNEGNNRPWKTVYVGLPGPVMLDSGNASSDVAFSTTTGFGFVDEGQPDVLDTCGSGNATETYRLDPSGAVKYRFDYLQPGHFYHLDITLHECDGAGREESIYIDALDLSANPAAVAGPFNLSNGEVRRISLLVDPAFYADHTIEVTIHAPGIDGAVVSEVNLHDIDYRYADAGGPNDPQYPGSRAFGWLDSVVSTSWGTLPYQSVRVSQGATDNDVRYRFDAIDPGRAYDLNLIFWQPSGTGRTLAVEIDGQATGLIVNTGDYIKHEERIAIPSSAYADGSIVVRIVRTDASTGAMVSEIALEEATLPRQNVGPHFTDCAMNTGANATVVIPSTVTVIGGLIMQTGDEIAVASADGTVCAGSGVWSGSNISITAWGDDVQTAEIDGLASGEVMRLQIWDQSESVLYENVTPTYSQGNGIYSSNSFHVVDTLDLNTTTTQEITLTSGWNMISAYVTPTDPAIAAVLAGIVNDVVLVKNGAGEVYWPDFGIDQIGEWDELDGYQVYMSNPRTLEIAGTKTSPELSPITLPQGWSLIAYLRDAPHPVDQALSSVLSQLLLAKNNDGQVYWPAFGINQIGNMQPGQGYQVYMNSSGTLTYPSDPLVNLNGMDGSDSN
jgi:hypothetical protein